MQDPYKISNKSNFSSNLNFKPNINELKQLFDNSRHFNVQQKQHFSGSGSYCDAKPSFIDCDNPFEIKDKSLNMFDFEKAKQKFDNISRSSSGNSKPSSRSSNQHPSFIKPLSSSSGNSAPPKRPNNLNNDPNNIPNNKQNEQIQYFDNNKLNFTKSTNVNLDGLKISEDDEVSWAVASNKNHN